MRLVLYRKDSMKEEFFAALEKAGTLDEVFDGVMDVFRAYVSAGLSGKFWYVSGVITSYGNSAENITAMVRRTEMLKEISDGVVFAPTCVFSQTLVERLQTNGYRHEHWMAFWTRVLCSGYVGAVVVTPGWERSRGADMEYAIARNLGLAIYYYDDTVLSVLE